jgi:hypothetical protein
VWQFAGRAGARRLERTRRTRQIHHALRRRLDARAHG